jgi:hypothetical protein
MFDLTMMNMMRREEIAEIPPDVPTIIDDGAEV